MAASRGKLALIPLALPLTLFASPAFADDNPCGKFDLSDGIDCHIELHGGCTAHCTPLQFEAYCQGGCTTQVTQTCTGTCETKCVSECDPNHLDCVAGCHGECEQPCIDQCKTAHPMDDCVTECKGSCDMHCDSACGVTVNSCLEHCRECCHGACDTQVNFDCDAKCFADLKGGCEAQCEAPSGSLFCNGQYVHASDVDACISYLATKGIKVNVDARGSVTCDLNGCKGAGQSSVGSCWAAPANAGESPKVVMTGIAVMVSALFVSASRRRGRSRR